MLVVGHYGFDESAYTQSTLGGRLAILLAAQEHIFAQEDGKGRLLKVVTVLSKAFALAVSHQEALAIRDDVSLLQAVRTARTLSWLGDLDVPVAVASHVDAAHLARDDLLHLVEVKNDVTRTPDGEGLGAPGIGPQRWREAGRQRRFSRVPLWLALAPAHQARKEAHRSSPSRLSTGALLAFAFWL